MTDPPTVIVDGDPENLQDCILHIDGDLPTVTEMGSCNVEMCDDPHCIPIDRPLRAGDRVTLVVEQRCDYLSCNCVLGEHPFATATVADIDTIDGHMLSYITVTDVEALS
jgi:hypothetical protein